MPQPRTASGRAAVVALGLVLGAALPALARDNPHLERGIELIGKMEDRAAMRALREALAWPHNTDAHRARIYVHMG